MSDRRRKYQDPPPRSRWVDYRTALADAFLSALLTWATRHASNTSAQITIPTGIVTASELMRVLDALDRARRGDRRDGSHASSQQQKGRYHYG
jgi:hypothetical protein